MKAGTNPVAAEKISRTDFRVDLAGSAAGTLYGRGLYFAEHCTKADECELAPGTRGSEASKLCGSAVLQASRVRDAVDAGYQGPFGR